MISNNVAMAKPGNAAIRVGANGDAWIEAFRCSACGAVVTEQTMACRRCGARDTVDAFRAAEKGKLYSWSVVHRSYPGVAVPFVSAIVDLDDGLTLKGTLRTAPAELHQGLPVRLVFDDAGGATDKEGVPYVGFHFVTAGEGQ